MGYTRIPLDKFIETFSTSTELSSVALGGQVISVSDEFFAEAFNLLLVEPAPSLKGQFGPNGALFSGWESRRHNPSYDWCIIKLGTSGVIEGFDVDTAHFNGNEAPQVSIDILHSTESVPPLVNDPRWSEILPKVDLGPSSRHLFKVPESSRVNYVKLNMYPDGGIARFRVYGSVSPVYPADISKTFDLAHVFAGGRVEYTSDQHFGVGSNLILPGRGKDMGDGWETKRSRTVGHRDWVVLKLGAPGLLEQVELDTNHFKGNFPESCELHATSIPESHTVAWGKDDQDVQWTPILARTKLGPHRQHYFVLDNVQGKSYTHVKATIYPDGGLKRIRVIGKRSGGNAAANTTSLQATGAPEIGSGIIPRTSPSTKSTPGPNPIRIPVVPLTPEAFAPFGNVIQAYGDHAAAPRGTVITPANGGTASKFHKLALLDSSYPATSRATLGLSVYRCSALEDVEELDLTVMERHLFTTQAFVPMGKGAGEGLLDPGEAYLVVVTQNGADDKPDLAHVRAFVATGAQGIMYNAGIWHQPMTVLKKPMDFTCVETQVGDGSKADCEIVELDSREGVLKLILPKY